MATTLKIVHHATAVSPYATAPDDHDDRLHSLVSPPSSPTSVCDTADRNNNSIRSITITAENTSATTDLSVSPFKDKSKRRYRTLGRKPSIAPSSSLEEKKTKRSVKFHSRVRFKHIKHIDDYSDREYFATWYVEEDLQEVFDHCVETVRRMVNGNVLQDENGYCPRGLEYKTPTGAKTRKQNKSKGIRIVLDEQERQRSEGINDPVRLAKLYYESATDSRRAYRLLAMQDQEEARPILQSKSSVVVLREKFQQQQMMQKMRSECKGSEDDENLHESVTSVVDEFRHSYCHGNKDENKEPTSVDVREFHVAFGSVEMI
jgi:hypothetical protein